MASAPNPSPLALGPPALAGPPRVPKVCTQDGCKRRLDPATRLRACCPCGRAFCDAHRPADAHACTHDYRAASRTVLSAAMIPTGDLDKERKDARKAKFGLDF